LLNIVETNKANNIDKHTKRKVDVANPQCVLFVLPNLN